MAESLESADKVADKTSVIPQMPTQITAIQIIALILALAACRFASGFLAPLLFAIMASLALAPLVKTLTRLIPRWIAAAIVVISITSAFGFTMWLLSDDIANFSRRLPSIVREIRSVVQSA